MSFPTAVASPYHALAVLLPLYRYAVRPTFIGAVLNGRKYPSALTPAAAV